MSPSIGAIILAGGRSSRMGADKAQAKVDGVRLVDALVSSLPQDVDYVVVSPFELGVPTVSEDPPFGGPVAGIAAGREALDHDYIAVLSVDAPASAGFVARLAEALESSQSECAVVEASDGYLQPLCAMWQAQGLDNALSSLGDVRDKSAKSLIRAARSTVVIKGDGQEQDYDTPEELRTLGEVEL